MPHIIHRMRFIFIVFIILCVWAECNAYDSFVNKIHFSKSDVNHKPTFEENAPKPESSFIYPDDKNIFIYINIDNVDTNFAILVHWFSPDGNLFKKDNWTMKQKDNNEWFKRGNKPVPRRYHNTAKLATEDIKHLPGKWKANIYIDGKFTDTKEFTLSVKSTGPPSGKDKSTTAASITKEQAKDYYKKGNLAFEAKNYGDAVLNYKRATELDNTFAPLFYNLAMAQMAVGQKDEAITNLKEYLRLRPDAANASDVKKTIEGLKKKQ